MSKPQPTNRSWVHSFDIDTYLNPFIPRPRWHYLPGPITHFFGYRARQGDTNSSRPQDKQVSVLLVWLFSFLGGFIGIAIIEHVYLALPRLNNHDVPMIIASFGAAAILEYNTIESPLAQPRNVLLGHTISAAIGVSITKLFQLLPPTRFEELRWLAGALSVGAASTAMAMTKTIHPPAGATALLAATNDQVMNMGWWLLALVVLGSVLMLTSALIVNNLYKRFPLYWWTPVDLQQLHRSRKSSRSQSDIIRLSDVESGLTKEHLPTERQNSTSETDGRSSHSGSDLTVTESREDPSYVSPPPQQHVTSTPYIPSSTLSARNSITISSSEILIPDHISLSPWEKDILDSFRARLGSGTSQ